MPLGDLLEGLQRNQPLSRAVSVTFDDGLENNASVAFPILQEFNIPSTFFITTGFINSQAPFGGFCWPDLVHALLNGCRTASLNLSDLGLGKVNLQSDHQILLARHRICRYLKQIPNIDKIRIIEAIREKTNNRVLDSDRETFSPMSWKQIHTIQKNRLGTIGAHTVSHPILRQVDAEESEKEMVQSKYELEQELGVPIKYFAYPNGTQEDFDSTIAAQASKHFTCALSTIPGFNDSGTDMFALRRLTVWNEMPLWKFKMHLSGVVQFFRPQGGG